MFQPNSATIYYPGQFYKLAGLTWVVLIFHMVPTGAQLGLAHPRWLQAHDCYLK